MERCDAYQDLDMSVILVGLLGNVWFNSSYAGEGTAPSPEAANNIGSVLIKAYTFEPVRPNPPNHLWLDEGNGRVQFLMFDKPVSDPSAILLFVGQGIKGNFVLNLSLMEGRQALTIFIGPIRLPLEIRRCTARKERQAIG